MLYHIIIYFVHVTYININFVQSLTHSHTSDDFYYIRIHFVQLRIFFFLFVLPVFSLILILINRSMCRFIIIKQIYNYHCPRIFIKIQQHILHRTRINKIVLFLLILKMLFDDKQNTRIQLPFFRCVENTGFFIDAKHNGL